MISCDDYQNKIVAVLDNEVNEDDEKMLFTHLAECPECRAFHAEAIRTRHIFSIAMATKPKVTIRRQFMRMVEAEAQQWQNRSGPPQIHRQTRLKTDSRHLVIAGGLVAAVLLIVSWLACYSMSRELAELQGQLQGAQQDLAIAHAQGQSEEGRNRERKAITALYLRMAELEQRVEQVSRLRNTLLPEEQYGLSGKQDGLYK